MATPPQNAPSRTPQVTSSPELTPSPARKKLAAERAQLLFGSYRRGDANDPDTYVVMIAATLAAYDDWVILEATHPRTGIQFTENFKSWPPNPGELKEFCDAMAKRAARYAVYEKLPKPDLTPRLPPPPDTRPGRCANLHVPAGSPYYAAMVALAETADPKDWCWYSDHPEHGNGIKIPMEWYPKHRGSHSGSFRQAMTTTIGKEHL